MECTGYWDTCQCEDCQCVAALYEDLVWYHNNGPEEYQEEIKELENKIESMGYFV